MGKFAVLWSVWINKKLLSMFSKVYIVWITNLLYKPS